MLAGVGTAPVPCSRFCGAGGRVAVLLHTVCGLLLHLVSLGILVSVSADVRRLLFCSLFALHFFLQVFWQVVLVPWPSWRSSASWSLWLLRSAYPLHVRLRVRILNVRSLVAVCIPRHLGLPDCWCPQVACSVG